MSFQICLFSLDSVLLSLELLFLLLLKIFLFFLNLSPFLDELFIKLFILLLLLPHFKYLFPQFLQFSLNFTLICLQILTDNLLLKFFWNCIDCHFRLSLYFLSCLLWCIFLIKFLENLWLNIIFLFIFVRILIPSVALNICILFHISTFSPTYFRFSVVSR